MEAEKLKEKEAKIEWDRLRKEEVKFLIKNQDKKFVITGDFYEAATTEFQLQESLMPKTERALITFRESVDSQFVFGNKVYRHLFLIKKKFIATKTPMMAFSMIGVRIYGIWKDKKKFLKLAEREGKFPYLVHTHPVGSHSSMPSYSDLLYNSPGILISQEKRFLQEIKIKMGLATRLPDIALFCLGMKTIPLKVS